MSNPARTQTTARISHHRLDGVMVIRPVGSLDRDLAGEVRHAVLSARTPVVIDVSDCVLADPASLHRLTSDWELYRPEMCVVSCREGGRQLLSLAGVDEHVAVFEDVGDAIAARADGWFAGRTR